DNQGNIYVIDAGSDSLFKFTSTGKELHSFGGTGSGEKQFKNPHGVAHFNKTLYVADTGNDRIVRFKLSTDID
ncbi:MAG: 6-bladed beta-propeller, partial [candidate division KSB1 bacterium]|nr:6-bladed beta-propeller [candidate division KSB1 bacterium]